MTDTPRRAAMQSIDRALKEIAEAINTLVDNKIERANRAYLRGTTNKLIEVFERLEVSADEYNEPK